MESDTEFSYYPSSNSDRSDILDEDYNEITQTGIQPYLFEPTIEVADSTGDTPEAILDANVQEVGEDTHVSVDDNWCHCNRCHLEARALDRVCCHVLNNDNLFQTNCFTDMEEFERICLYPPYLEIILVGLSQLRGDALEAHTCNRSFRFASYTAFTWWVHGKLGRYNRRVIPSCVIWKIRDMFPEESGTYVNFKPGSRD